MGRVKIAMEFISKEKARNNTYVKRKKGLLKKCHELSILCNVPICIIIYPYKDETKQPSIQPEVYSFKGNATESTAAAFSPSDFLASDPKIAWEIIDRYLKVPNEEKIKRSINLYDMFGEWTKKADQELYKLRHKNALANYPFSSISSNDFSVEQLVELLVFLDQKIEFVNQRIDMIRSNNHNHNHNHNQETTTIATETTTGLVPKFEPTPMSCFINPNNNNNYSGENNNNNNNNNNNQICCSEFGGFNQFPLFNYPIINNNDDHNNQECYDQIVHFNQQSALFPHHHQVFGATNVEDHDGSSSGNNNLFMYNITGGVRVGPTCYDQRSGFIDNVGATSSYGGGLPMTMPVQLPMLHRVPNNVSLPRQRQCQVFYN